mmetsp:Transcript_70954/g.154170  ORF Transcript_70954/g.154170 Transcript_70954/m.154170 type:complete len:677 (+) Transcript_70954:88-2118(+)
MGPVASSGTEQVNRFDWEHREYSQEAPGQLTPPLSTTASSASMCSAELLMRKRANHQNLAMNLADVLKQGGSQSQASSSGNRSHHHQNLEGLQARGLGPSGLNGNANGLSETLSAARDELAKYRLRTRGPEPSDLNEEMDQQLQVPVPKIIVAEGQWEVHIHRTMDTRKARGSQQSGRQSASRAPIASLGNAPLPALDEKCVSRDMTSDTPKASGSDAANGVVRRAASRDVRQPHDGIGLTRAGERRGQKASGETFGGAFHPRLPGDHDDEEPDGGSDLEGVGLGPHVNAYPTLGIGASPESIPGSSVSVSPGSAKSFNPGHGPSLGPRRLYSAPNAGEGRDVVPRLQLGAQSLNGDDGQGPGNATGDFRGERGSSRLSRPLKLPSSHVDQAVDDVLRRSTTNAGEREMSRLAQAFAGVHDELRRNQEAGAPSAPSASGASSGNISALGAGRRLTPVLGPDTMGGGVPDSLRRNRALLQLRASSQTKFRTPGTSTGHGVDAFRHNRELLQRGSDVSQQRRPWAGNAYSASSVCSTPRSKSDGTVQSAPAGLWEAGSNASRGLQQDPFLAMGRLPPSSWRVSGAKGPKGSAKSESFANVGHRARRPPRGFAASSEGRGHRESSMSEAAMTTSDTSWDTTFARWGIPVPEPPEWARGLLETFAPSWLERTNEQHEMQI